MKVNARSLLAGLTLVAACYSDKGTTYAVPLPQPAVNIPAANVSQLPRSTEAEERDEQLLALRDYVETVQELGGSAFKRALMRKRSDKGQSASSIATALTTEKHVKRDPQPSLQNININISGPGECSDDKSDGCDEKKNSKKHKCEKECKEGCKCDCCKSKSDESSLGETSNDDKDGLNDGLSGSKSSLGPLGSSNFDDGLYDDDLAMDPYSGMNGSKGPSPIPPKPSPDSLAGSLDDGMYDDDMAMDPYSGMNGSKGLSSKPPGPGGIDPSLDPYGLDDSMGSGPPSNFGAGLGGGSGTAPMGPPSKMPTGLDGPGGAYDDSYDLGPDLYGLDNGIGGGAGGSIGAGMGNAMASTKGPRSTPPGMDPYDDLYPYDLPSGASSGLPSGPPSHPNGSSTGSKKALSPYDDPYGYDPTLDGPMDYDPMLDGPMSAPSGPSSGLTPPIPGGSSSFKAPPGIDANSTKIVFKPLDDSNTSSSLSDEPNRAITSGGFDSGIMKDLNGDGIYDDLPPYSTSGPSGLGNHPSAPPLPSANKNYFIYPITDSSKTITLNKGDMVAYVDKQGHVGMSSNDMGAAADEMLGGGPDAMYGDSLPPLSDLKGGPAPHNGSGSSSLGSVSGPPSGPGFDLNDLYGGPPPSSSSSSSHLPPLPPTGLPGQPGMPPKHSLPSTGPPLPPPMMKRSHPRMFEMDKRSPKKNKEVALFTKRGEQATYKREA